MNRFILLIALLTLSLCLSAFPVKITSWDIKNDVKVINGKNLIIEKVNRTTQSIIIDIRNPNDYENLISLGLSFERIPDESEIYARQLFDETMLSDNPLRNYYSLNEYHSFLTTIASQYPTICQLVQFGTSVQNRPLYFLKISDNINQQENEPEFQYVSSIHGNEVVGYDILIRLIQYITSQYGTNPRINNIVNNTEIWICPMFNPDGFSAIQRYNANGVDLNRNFPLPVGSQHPDGLTWQPETIAFMNHSLENNIVLSANYHGGALVVNYPWDYTYVLAPDNDLIIQAALSYSSHNLPMYNSSEFSQGITNGAEWYVALGTLQDWSYGVSGDIDFTIEVSEEGWPPEAQLDIFWQNNLESALSLLEYVQIGIHGTVTDTQGNPLEAQILINEPGITIRTDPQVGDYHRLLLPGSYTISAFAQDYSIASANITIPFSGSIIHNFILEPVIYNSFSGYATDQFGLPVSGATGSLTYGTSVYNFQTNAAGEYSLPQVPAGLLDLTLSSPNHGLIRNKINLSAEDNRQCLIMPTPSFEADFEGVVTGWNLQNPWAVATLVGSQVLADSPSGNYSNNIVTQASISNSISLNSMSSATLTFQLRYNLENNYDFLYVQASTGGVTWDNLAVYSGNMSTWQSVVITLDDYCGQDLYIRFRLETDNSVTADGVYIDNVFITGLKNNETVFGDVDSNWIINLSDINNVIEYSVGNDPIPIIDPAPWQPFRVAAADVDDNNFISATDAYYIYQRIMQTGFNLPVQGGDNIIFDDPILSFNASIPGTLIVDAQELNHLKAFTLNFGAIPSLTITSVNWNNEQQNVIYASNTNSKSISLVSLDNPNLLNELCEIEYQTTGTTIHCQGLVNDTELDNVITSNPDDNELPLVTRLLGNYPNPFAQTTSVKFSSSITNNKILISIYNSKGQKVRSLGPAMYNKGTHAISFDGTDSNGLKLSNGLYYYKLRATDITEIGKMVILK